MRTKIYQGQLYDEFEGFDENMLFKTDDGKYWLQAIYKYWYHYEYRPEVAIYQDNGRYYLVVDGEEVEVKPATNVVESNIDGEFNGWEGETIYTLRNGQVWQQSSYKYTYKYAYSPSVVIFQGDYGMVMNVAGTSANVKRIK